MLRLRAALRTVRTMDGFRQCHRFVGPLLGGRSLSLQTRWFVLHGTECGMWALALLQLGFVAPITASVLGTFALFFLKHARMRLVMLSGTVLWLFHNYWVGSVGGTLLEGVLCIVNIVTLVRMMQMSKITDVHGIESK